MVGETTIPCDSNVILLHVHPPLQESLAWYHIAQMMYSMPTYVINNERFLLCCAVKCQLWPFILLKCTYVRNIACFKLALYMGQYRMHPHAIITHVV